MKTNILKSLFFLFLFLSLVACDQEKSAIISSQSENGEIKVNVQGTRYLSTDPYKIAVVAITKFDTLAVEVEAMVETLNEKNVTFNWKSNNECYVYITQRDGSVRTIPISIMTN